MLSSSSASSSVPLVDMLSTRDTWNGIDIDEERISVLRYRRKLPPVELVATHVLGAENSSALWDGEVVVFALHFSRGLGMPASHFLSLFLMHYRLPPHHVAPNTIMQLSAFVTLCEGFLGITPHLDIWTRLFFFKQLSVMDKATGENRTTPCRAALVYHRSGSSFPQLPLQDLVQN
ncbi:hypothetical protein D1007_17182 [Hordeum vulgare]|nr:hypothetical protein D1007_17182 [Hordeum vulgare]